MSWLDTARRIIERKQFEVVHPVTGEPVEYEWKPDPDGEYAEAQDHEVVVSKDGEGVLLDAFTASLMIQVHDALGPDNQARYVAMPLSKAVPFTYKLLERTQR